MTSEKRRGCGEPVGEPDDDHSWTFSRDPSVRALLDHVAEELAAEFVRLMKASVVAEADAETEKEDR